MERSVIHNLIAALPVAVVAVDHEARVSAANVAASALLGENLTDRPFVTVLRHPVVVQAVDAVLDPAHVSLPVPDPTLAAVGSGGYRNRVIISARGRDIPAEVTVSALPDRIGALVVIEDSSGIEEAEQQRRDFVANVSHELRTPLTAMIGFIETLRGPARDDAAARDRFLSIMETEAARMNRLVMDLLSLSRVESEERRRPAEAVDLTMIIGAVVATLTPHAEAHNVNISLIGAENEALVTGDPDQLTQVFHNLVENAVKYGGSGGEVRLELSRIRHEPALRGPAIAVAVIDRGEGIDEMHLPRLTERFYRVDNHRSRQQGGTGLGLAIVKHIIGRHRGRLRIESVKGQGSRFTVILPAKRDRR
ncbi:cell wall metabolism sensor histidine kinase WalK [Paracoccus sp. SCSIO 75233]|uniref:sensor histidine kinase n=1 Tax=Paracoccus sp. SCSIO 75233 TaxID=3017782 RepID=UPI0022F0C673|nr:ATP-binding protein [Paracoccus sp. SCSIO 75233]WBU54395.1 ATP-binding protein [Paracoccus sp. SCSIO 75233]